MNPDDKARSAAFYDGISELLAMDHIKDNGRLRVVKSKLAATVKDDQTVLDLGCGTGLTSKWIAQHGATVTAVDISPKLIKFARKDSAHKKVKYILSDITELDLKKKFDGIVMVDCLEHIPRTYLPDILDVIERHSHDHTWFYLNIPDGRYQNLVKKHVRDRLQLVEESYFVDDILNLLIRIDYEPIDIDIYGLDVCFQYNSFLFLRGGMFANIHLKFMKGILNGKH